VAVGARLRVSRILRRQSKLVRVNPTFDRTPIYEYNPARSRAARLSHHALACSPDLEQRDGSVRSVYLLIGSGVVCEQDAAAGGEAVSPRSFSGGGL
jgi:hypothetical protein